MVATLANWRLPPFNRWSFGHIDELLACKAIARGQPRPLITGSPVDLSDVKVAWQGATHSVASLLDVTYSDSLLVLRDGMIVCERYDNGTADGRHILFSVSKSVTGALAGVLVDKGQLDPQAPVTEYVPEVAGSAYGDCTVRHVLDMSVAVRFVEDYLDPLGDFARYRAATAWNPPDPKFGGEDLHGFIATLPKGDREHGSRFHYVSPNSDLLGWILERAGGEPLYALASRLLWQPMGAESDALITIDNAGSPRSAGGICTTLRDLARFGELMRCYGQADGQQIIPRSWVEDILHNGDPEAWQRGSSASLFPHGRYRSKWYVPGDVPGVMYALGIHGQWIYIDPNSAMVAVKFSSQPLPSDDNLDRLNLAIFRALAAYL